MQVHATFLVTHAEREGWSSHLLLLLLASNHCCLRGALSSEVHITDKILCLLTLLDLPHPILAGARATVLGHWATCLRLPQLTCAAVPEAVRAEVWTVSACNTEELCVALCMHRVLGRAQAVCKSWCAHQPPLVWPCQLLLAVLFDAQRTTIFNLGGAGGGNFAVKFQYSM